MKKINVLSICLAFILCVAFSASAGMGGFFGKGKMHGKWWKLPDVSEKLKLTDDEKKALDELYVGVRTKMISLRADAEKERFALEVLLDKETLDEAACLEQFDKSSSARALMGKEHFTFLLEVRKLLGLERFQQLKEVFHMHKKGMGKKHGRRGLLNRRERRGSALKDFDMDEGPGPERPDNFQVW